MRKRYRLFAFRIYEYKLLEAYLNRMAVKGWCIKSYHKYYAGLLVFEKTEPNSVTYMVDYYAYQKGKDEEEGLRQYREFVEDFGYRFLAGDGGLQIYEKIHEDAVVIREEDEENLVSMRMTVKAVLRSYLGFMVFMLIMLYQSYAAFQSTFFVENSDFCSMLVFLCACLQMCTLAVPDMIWMIRKRKHMAIWKVTIRTMNTYLLFVAGAFSVLGWWDIGMILVFILLGFLVFVYQKLSRKLECMAYTVDQKRIRRFWAFMGCFVIMMFALWNLSKYHEGQREARAWNASQEGLFVDTHVLGTYEQQVTWIQVKQTPIKEFIKNNMRNRGERKWDTILSDIRVYEIDEEIFDAAYVLIEDTDGFYYMDQTLLPEDPRDISTQLLTWKKEQ